MRRKLQSVEHRKASSIVQCPMFRNNEGRTATTHDCVAVAFGKYCRFLMLRRRSAVAYYDCRWPISVNVPCSTPLLHVESITYFDESNAHNLTVQYK